MNQKTTGLSRRQFLRSTGAVALMSALAPADIAALESAVIKKAIPASGEKLSVIGLGTSRTFDVDSSQAAQSPLVEVMQAFFANGGQLIDSSPMYGSAEAVTGELLRAVKDKSGLFTATKVWTYGKQEGIQQMRQSMRRLGVDRIDLMQIHNLRDWETHIETLREWKTQGKIRYLGITTSHGRFHAELEKIMQQQPLDFVQLSYNILDRTVERRLLPLAQERGIATLINRPYQRGSLFRKVRGKSLPAWAADFDCASWGQFFLKFIVSHPAATCAIPATSKLKHMVDNMAAGFGRLPDASTRQRMIDYVESL
ncbi:MAG: aldo/keto reductase [Gammaproteobacteria bacterium]|nr:MAG: aldo/keto reductase [Gammaproteobacteria bacterium]UCH39967.1 MAG: aldo/keto reductase [Gammaproteobacteria bacterium]